MGVVNVCEKCIKLEKKIEDLNDIVWALSDAINELEELILYLIEKNNSKHIKAHIENFFLKKTGDNKRKAKLKINKYYRIYKALYS